VMHKVELVLKAYCPEYRQLWRGVTLYAGLSYVQLSTVMYVITLVVSHGGHTQTHTHTHTHVLTCTCTHM